MRRNMFRLLALMLILLMAFAAHSEKVNALTLGFDLYVADLWISRSQTPSSSLLPNIGERYFVHARISAWWGDVVRPNGEYRIGGYPATKGCPVQPCQIIADLYVNSTLRGSEKVVDWEGRSAFITFSSAHDSWAVAHEGEIEFKVVVNGNHSIPEEHYENNEFVRTYVFPSSSPQFPSPFTLSPILSHQFDKWPLHVASWPTGQSAYVSLRNGTILTIDSSQSTSKFAVPQGFGAAHIAVSADGKYVVVGDNYHSASLYIANGTQIWTKSLAYGYEQGVSVSSDGERAAVAFSRFLAVYDNVGNLLWQIPSSQALGSIFGVGISPDGTYVAFSATNVILTPYGDTYFGLANQTGVLWLHQAKGRVTNAVVSENGKYVAFASDDGNLYVFDRSGRLILQSPAAGKLMLDDMGETRLASGTLFDESVFILATAGGLIRVVLLDGSVFEYFVGSHIYSISPSWEFGYLWVAQDFTLHLFRLISSDSALLKADELLGLARSVNLDVSSQLMQFKNAEDLNRQGLVVRAYEQAQLVFKDTHDEVMEYIDGAIVNMTAQVGEYQKIVSSLEGERKNAGMMSLNQSLEYIKLAKNLSLQGQLKPALQQLKMASNELAKIAEINVPSSESSQPNPTSMWPLYALAGALIAAVAVVAVLFAVVTIRMQRGKEMK